eukprot:XP_025012212.1 purine permease 1 isoform X2 [Ricinus communis]
MEAEQGSNSRPKQQENSKHIKILLVVLNCLLMSIGQVGGPLLIRLYYLHGGKRKWLTSWLLTAGFPILILPISSSYMIARARSRAPTSRLLLTRWLFAASAFIGLLLGLDGYLYSFVVLMTFGSIILGFHMNGDVPNGESNGKYVLGFFMAVGAAALHGFIMPAVEYTHMNAGMPITFDLVMQVQFLISMFATLFCTIPMIINKDFQAIPKEAEKFGLGQAKYYTILVVAAVIMQLLIIGSLGVIFASTSLLGGLVSSLLVPVQQVFAVIFLHEVFNAEKGMALAMCLWGFASHLYGAYVESSKKQAKKKEESNCEVI